MNAKRYYILFTTFTLVMLSLQAISATPQPSGILISSGVSVTATLEASSTSATATPTVPIYDSLTTVPCPLLPGTTTPSPSEQGTALNVTLPPPATLEPCVAVSGRQI